MGAHVCFSRVSFDVGVLKSFNRGLFVNCAFSWFLLSFALGKQNLLLVFREWNIYFLVCLLAEMFYERTWKL